MSSEITKAAFGALLAGLVVAGCGDDEDNGKPGNGGKAGASGSGGSASGKGGSASGQGGSGGAAGTQGRPGGEAGDSGGAAATGAGANGSPEGGSAGAGEGGRGAFAGEAGEAGEAGDGVRPAGGSAGSSDDGGAGGAGGGEPGLDVERWLAFRIYNPDDTYALFAAPVPAMAPPVPIAPDVEVFRFSADGTRLLFMTRIYGPGPNAAYVVPVTPSGIGEPELLHPPLTGPNDRVLNASISPDGQTLALQIFEGGESRWYIRPLADALAPLIPVGIGVAGDYAAEPFRRFSWSPEGQRLAIVEPEGGGYDHLTIVDSSGAGTEVSMMDLSLLGWSSDGSHVLADGLHFEPWSRRALYWIDAGYVYDVETLTEPGEESNDFSLAQVAPDGSAVAFKTAVAGEYDLFVKTIGSSEPPEKLEGLSVAGAHWLENSRGLLYLGYPPDAVNGPSLYSVPRDGDVFTRLNPDDTFAACVSNDCIRRAGDAFVFTSFNYDQTTNQLLDVTFDGTTPTVRPLTELPDRTIVSSFEVAPNPARVLMFLNGAKSHEVRYVDRGADPPVDHLVVSLPLDSNPYAYGAEGPAFSSDSAYFYYYANDDVDPNGMVDLFVTKIVDGAPTTPIKLTDHGPTEQLYGAAWQP